MKIDEEKCIGCGLCHPYCPVGAIATREGEGSPTSWIDQAECVECGNCHERSSICPTEAIYRPALEWPRSLREHFSNPHAKHPSTATQGRGTEEMKTNDVSGRYPLGVAGVAIEMGRPGVGTSLRDVQTVAMALAGAGVAFERENPVATLMADIETGKFKEEVLNEKVLSLILEFKIDNSRLGAILPIIKEVSARIDTVFSLDLINRVNPDTTISVIAVAEQAGFSPRPNTKTNVGLGKPRFKES